MSNPRNVFNCIGIIPKSEKLKFEYINKTGEEDRGVFLGNIGVRRAWKKKEDQYYPEDLIPFKAFGKTAEYIKNYVHRGDYVAITGEIRKDDNYEVNGEMRYGQLFLYIDLGGMTLIGGRQGNDERSAANAEATSNASTTPATPKSTPITRLRRHAVI